jgi:hypothetical protein
MEPEGSLPRSQEPYTVPCPEPDQPNRYHPIQSKIHFTSDIPSTKSHIHFLSLIFYGEELLAPRPTHKLEEPLIGCPRLLIQYICSYTPYLGAVSIRNLRTCHAVVTRDPPIHYSCSETSPSFVDRYRSIQKSVTFEIGRLVFSKCLFVWEVPHLPI